MIIKEAIVLAGGLGTRLKSVLPDTPKCMAPVKGKPFLVHVLDFLVEQGINRLVLSVGYHNDQIISVFGSSYKSLSIEYAIENEPLGTGGAVKLALSYCKGDNVFILNGDTYFSPELNAIEELHFKADADVTIAVKQMKETSRYGLIDMDLSGRIIAFREKVAESGEGWINGGLYLVKRQIFDKIEYQKFSLENDMFKQLFKSIHIQAFKTDAFFIDIGIPEDYKRAESLLFSKRKV